MMAIPSAILREHSLTLFQTGIAAADPESAVNHYLLNMDGQLRIGPDQQNAKFRSRPWSKIHLIAFGKAACLMTKAALQHIPTTLLSAPPIAVTPYDSAESIDGVRVLGAGHPLPDQQGFAAAQQIARQLQTTTANELVMALISGGGSALLPYPVDGISLDEKIATTQLLLACGANINQINCVRKHLSKIKGGGVARLAAPADLHALILSDVIGDDLSAIASGPTVADSTTFQDALVILKQYQVWDQAPFNVRNYLQQGATGLHPETSKPGDPVFANTVNSLIGSNTLSVEALFSAAQNLGYHAQIYAHQLTGEARHVATNWATTAKNLQVSGFTQSIAMIAGGETTVTLTGNGKGGRNQEMALAFALAAEQQGLTGNWTFLSGGTDGRDGPTDAAGGCVNPATLDKIRHAGIDPQAALNNNDAYVALKAADALVVTGATGTNVADLQILLLHPFTD